MKILLDTCVMLWLFSEPEKISPKVMERFLAGADEFYVSPVAFWEIGIKRKNNFPSLPDFHTLNEWRQQHDLWTISFQADDTAPLENLPDIHRDPFDRLLICQTINQGMALMTPDHQIQKYPIKVIW